MFIHAIALALSIGAPSHLTHYALTPLTRPPAYPPASQKEQQWQGLGKHRRAITTKSKEAQRYFDQGMAFLYGFNHDEAIRSFKAATEADPKCAMAWWGLAMANGPHVNNPNVPPEREKAGSEAMSRAMLFAKDAKPVERALVQAGIERFNRIYGIAPANDQQSKGAASVRTRVTLDRPTLDKNFANAMREAVKQFPNDPDVVILTAESLMDLQPWDYWNPDGSPKGNTNEITRLVERALKLDPTHPQACHLAIHAWEGSIHPAKAIKAADTLRNLQPALGHMVHMPSHTDVRVGSWDKAVLANEKAIASDEAYRKVRPVIGFYRLYMSHNRHMLAYSAMMVGRSKEAIGAIDNMISAIPKDVIAQMGPILDGYFASPWEVRMRFGKWDEIINLPAPPPGLPLTAAIRHASMAIAYAAKGDLNHAYEAERQFQEARRTLPPSAWMGQNSGAAILAIAGPMVRGEILIKEGNMNEGIEELRKAVAAEDGMRYDEPPEWINPCRHALGAALMKAGRFSEAEAVYREDLRKLPNNGWSLYGLSQALRSQGKIAEMRPIAARFAEVWQGADIQISSSCLCLPGR